MKTYKDAMNVVIEMRNEIEERISDVKSRPVVSVEDRTKQLIRLHGHRIILSVLLDDLARNEIE